MCCNVASWRLFVQGSNADYYMLAAAGMGGYAAIAANRGADEFIKRDYSRFIVVEVAPGLMATRRGSGNWRVRACPVRHGAAGGCSYSLRAGRLPGSGRWQHGERYICGGAGRRGSERHRCGVE